MKQFLTLILAILCSTSIALATIYTGTTGKCTYTLDTDEGTLVISGTGAMEDYECYDEYLSNAPWNDYGLYIKTVTIEDGVTSIGDYAFYWCTSLTSVTIGSGVTSIGNYAFNRCTKLTSVTIGSSVTSIGKYAFYNCSSLTSVTSLAITPPTCSGDPFSSDTYEQATLYAASNMYKYTTYWKDFTTIEYTDNAQMYSTTYIGQCGDNLIYTLDLEDGSVVIEGSGDMYDYDNYSSYAPWITYSDIIEPKNVIRHPYGYLEASLWQSLENGIHI